jgi:hypothetical protein
MRVAPLLPYLSLNIMRPASQMRHQALNTEFVKTRGSVGLQQALVICVDKHLVGMSRGLAELELEPHRSFTQFRLARGLEMGRV